MLPTGPLSVPSCHTRYLLVCLYSCLLVRSGLAHFEAPSTPSWPQSKLGRMWAIDGSEICENKNKSAQLEPEQDPLDLVNGTQIPSVYDLHLNKNLRLLLYFNYGLNSFNVKKLVLNPRFYSKYVIIQSK